MFPFSGLQRSRYDEKDYLIDYRKDKKEFLEPKKIILFLLLYLVYEPLTTFYFYLPPLIGVVVWITYTNPPFFEMIAWFIYLYLFEVDHSLPSFSLFIVLFTSLWILKKLQGVVYCQECLRFLGIAITYGLLMAVLFVFNTFFYYDVHIPWQMVGLYILLDWAIAQQYEN